MSERYDPLLFVEDLDDEEREALLAELEDDPERAAAFRAWQQVRAALRRRLNERMPDRELLVLYALDHEGRADLLSDEEQQALEAARSELERALEAHPGLVDAVQCIKKDRALFEEVWREHTERTSVPEADQPSRADDHRPAAPSRSSQRRGGSIRRWVWRASGTVAVVIFVVLLALLFQRDQSMIAVTAPEGEVRVVELGSDSQVRLMGGSTLVYPDPSEETAFARKAKLEGHAFFDIVSQQEGFLVQTPTAVATVLGTRFGVTARENATEVVSVAGRVALAPREARDQVVVVEDGQMSRVASNALPTTPVSVDLSEALGWTDLFFFRATPMQAIAERLSRYYDVAIEVAQALQNEEVTGTFEQDQPVEEVLRVITATLDAEVRTAADGYRLVPAGA